uniref:glutathione peroxidase n=1 Tax=Takifugu rubripes TaxID=31033 RepID=A0A3B5K5T4_TAKRU
DPTTNGTIYDYSAQVLNGPLKVDFSDFRGKFVLFVNVEELRDCGFIILGFPSNQFGKQEPGAPAEILPGLKYVRPGKGFVPNFQLFSKDDVNGENEQGVYTFLKNSCSPVGGDLGDHVGRLFWEPMRISDIKWNFEKFLVGPDGKPIMRWHPSIEVPEVRADIYKHLHENKILD